VTILCYLSSLINSNACLRHVTADEVILKAKKLDMENDIMSKKS